MLSKTDHDRVAAAVAAAEQTTSAQILCALTHEASEYREVPLAWSAAVALVVPPLAFLAGLRPGFLATLLGGWTAAQATAVGSAIRLAIAGYALLQALLFAVVALVVMIPPVRRALTPRFLKRHRVRKAALHYFAAAGRHGSPERPVVVIFASLADRQVEMVMDDAAHQRLGREMSDNAVKALAEGMRRRDPASGFERAIAIIGEALAKAYPAQRQSAAKPADDLQEL